MIVCREVSVCRVVEEERVVKFPALRPGIRDQYGTTFPEDLIRTTAHSFNERLNRGYEEQGTGPKLMHTGKVDDGIFRTDLVIVESYITTQDETFPIEQAGAAEGASLFVPKGSWMVAMRVISDELWAGVKSGHFRGFSIGGIGETEPEEDDAEAA